MTSQALLKAVASARYTQTRLLLQMGADVNCQDPRTGETPLMWALALPDSSARAGFLRLLLRSGGKVSKGDWAGQNAVMRAVRAGNLPDLLLLLRHADDDFEVNSRDKGGRTALWLAAEGGEVEAVRELVWLLVGQEAVCEVADHEGVTPAARAASLGHLACLRTMVRQLHTAANSSQVATLELGKLKAVLLQAEGEGRKKKVTRGTCAHSARAAGSLPRRAGSTESSTSVQTVVLKRAASLKRSKSDMPTIRIYSSEGRQVGVLSPAGFVQAASVISTRTTSVPNSSRAKGCPNIPIPVDRHNVMACTDDAKGRALGSRVPSRVDRAKRISSLISFSSPQMGPAGDSGVPKVRRYGYSSGPDSESGHSQDSQSVHELHRILKSWAEGNPDYGSDSPHGDLLAKMRETLMRDSVKDRLPALFDLIAQQISSSFRKPAQILPSRSSSVASAQHGPAWTRLKGFAMATRTFTRKASLASARKLSTNAGSNNNNNSGRADGTDQPPEGGSRSGWAVLQSSRQQQAARPVVVVTSSS